MNYIRINFKQLNVRASIRRFFPCGTPSSSRVPPRPSPSTALPPSPRRTRTDHGRTPAQPHPWRRSPGSRRSHPRGGTRRWPPSPRRRGRRRWRRRTSPRSSRPARPPGSTPRPPRRRIGGERSRGSCPASS